MYYKRWQDEPTLKFIELYRSHPELWNINLPAYRSKDARRLAMNKLVKDMNLPGFTVADAKAKINCIRSAYCQELKKFERTKKTPTVIWFNTLDSFLNPFVFNRPVSKMKRTSKPQKHRINEESEDSESTLTEKSENIVSCPYDSLMPFDENQFDVFGRSVSIQLKSMPKRQALRVQLKLQTILTQEMLSYEDGVDGCSEPPSIADDKSDIVMIYDNDKE